MPLVEAKCTNCGANIPVDNTKDAAICPFCGSAFIVEKAINNYNTTNNINANVVNVYGGTTSDFVVRACELIGYNGSSTDVVIPNNVSKISGAFAGCTLLKSVIIPEGVVEIGRESFANCISLSSVSLPRSLKSISAGAFRNCKGLNSIVIPDNVVFVESGAFLGCTRLNKATIPGWCDAQIFDRDAIPMLSLKYTNGPEVLEPKHVCWVLPDEEMSGLCELVITDNVKEVKYSFGSFSRKSFEVQKKKKIRSSYGNRTVQRIRTTINASEREINEIKRGLNSLSNRNFVSSMGNFIDFAYIEIGFNKYVQVFYSDFILYTIPKIAASNDWKRLHKNDFKFI